MIIKRNCTLISCPITTDGLFQLYLNKNIGGNMIQLYYDCYLTTKNSKRQQATKCSDLGQHMPIHFSQVMHKKLTHSTALVYHRKSSCAFMMFDLWFIYVWFSKSNTIYCGCHNVIHLVLENICRDSNREPFKWFRIKYITLTDFCQWNNTVFKKEAICKMPLLSYWCVGLVPGLTNQHKVLTTWECRIYIWQAENETQWTILGIILLKDNISQTCMMTSVSWI